MKSSGKHKIQFTCTFSNAFVIAAAIFATTSLSDAATSVVWTSNTEGSLDGVNFTVSGSDGGRFITDLSGADFSADPLGASEQTFTHSDSSNITINFGSSLTNVNLYLVFWRGGITYTFDPAVTLVKLSGNSNFSVSGNTLTTTGDFSSFSNGIVQLTGTYNTIDFTVSGSPSGSSVGTTIALTAVPEPSSLLLTGLAGFFMCGFRRRNR